MTHVIVPVLLFILLGCFIELGALQDLFIQPEGTDGIVTLPLNQMGNATFDCECTVGNDCRELHWSLETNGVAITTNDNRDTVIFAERGITYSTSSDNTMTSISIPDTVENNNTQIFCAALLFGGTEFSNPVELIIIGPPLPPEPILVINSSSQLDIHWAVPYSNERYPIVSYNIEIVNMSSAIVLANVVDYNDTNFVHIFDDDVKYCQILTVNITAVNALASSVPGSASRGFPIAPHPFNMDIDVDVTFLRNGTPMASITFEAPRICDYQTANYSLTIEDVTDPRVDLEPIESTYTGSNRNVMEVVMLTIDHNYTLFVSVVENHFKIEVSASKNFTTLFQSGSSDASPSMSQNVTSPLISLGHPPHELGIYVGLPVAILLFLLPSTIV